MSELEAGLAQLEHLASQESQSAVDLKIADNKRNAALREKHIASLTAEREMKKKQLAEEKIKSGKLTQDFADVAEERDALEKTQKAKLKELQGLMNECAEKKAEGESTIERTIAYEREMKRKIREARKESDRMSQSILARMNNARKNSVFFQNERAEKEQKEREERERQKEEMREELEELKRTIEGMKESFKKENEAAERYYARIEREKDLFGKDANKDHEFKINLVQERIQQLNVKSSRELAEFDAELKQTTAQIEQEKANLKLVAEVAKASAKMKSDADQEHKLKETLWAIEREFTEQKQKVAELVRQEYDLQKELHKYDILPSEFAPAAPARKESANAPGPISQKQQAQPLNYSIQTQTAITQGKSQQQTQSRIPTASHLAQRSMQTAIPVPREFKLDDEGQMKSLLRQKTAEVQQSLQNFRRGVPQEQQVATMTELMSQSHLSVASKLHLAASQMEAEMRRDKSRIAILKTEGTKDQTKRPLVFQGKANLTPRPG
ncbi:histone-lysine N-methyltransferase, H3 lysine-79 specific-like [Neocloeon triangulifer]|uniref:histone-lysine N-methyltransferase, H3 lysine-79 specific-like n=1 Tax=Neocloeon triangulifer TaxID=2078957 RepID=UPI00286EFC9D|nr:histone-lysine N-methyltransferase, H3 lysine-79 specific-like [Neocloeon triangulifer]